MKSPFIIFDIHSECCVSHYFIDTKKHITVFIIIEIEAVYFVSYNICKLQQSVIR
jgi:hypothetical protein